MENFKIISYNPSISRVSEIVVNDRVDASYYASTHLELAQQMGSHFKLIMLGQVFDVTKLSGFEFTKYFTEQILKHGTIPCLMSENVRENEISLDSCTYITKAVHQELSRSSLDAGEIVLSYTGHYRRAAVVPESIINLHLGPNVCKITRKYTKSDPYFYTSFLNSSFGQRSLDREKTISAQPTVNMNRIRSLQVPDVLSEAQTYIGDKVRQAERLRKRSREFVDKINFLILTNDIQEALDLKELKCNRSKFEDLELRLDPKYYNQRAMGIFKACRQQSIPISNLITSVSNGFEHRQFVSEGLPYITVSEVSSGRLNLNTAPRIPSSVQVPDKARIHSCCVLVVRTGSIGKAVKIYHEDENASISSHLIRLEFQDESIAAAVAAFLNSQIGSCLLHKISYGAVQPQVGQDEVLSLPIPKAVLENAEGILLYMNKQEQAIRNSARLTDTAKLLIEALIEGDLKEYELKAAQEALQQGDNSLDREILSRLTRKGYNVSGEPPLFPDLDALYKALQEAESRSQESE